jgi:hypothetical protein
MKTNELMEECRRRFSTPKINKLMELHIEALDKAYDAGYNDAIEKALEWLKNIDFEKDYIDVDYQGCFFKEEDFINDFNKMMKE